MLSVLSIRNLAIIEHIEIEFGPGLNALTGETGAGKSIVLKALSMLSGQRAMDEFSRERLGSSIRQFWGNKHG